MMSFRLKISSISKYISGSETGRIKNRRGVTAIEYGLIAALIAVVIIGILTLLGVNLNVVYQDIGGNLQVLGTNLATYTSPSFSEAFANSSVEVWVGPNNSSLTITSPNTTSETFSGLTGVAAIPGPDGKFSDGAAIPSTATVSGDAHDWTVSNLPTSMVKTKIDQNCVNMGGSASETATGVTCSGLGYATSYNQNTFLGAYNIKP